MRLHLKSKHRWHCDSIFFFFLVSKYFLQMEAKFLCMNVLLTWRFQPPDSGCSVPLGMESLLIEDHHITASSIASSWYSGPWKPSLARLNRQGTINAWQAKVQILILTWPVNECIHIYCIDQVECCWFCNAGPDNRKKNPKGKKITQKWKSFIVNNIQLLQCNPNFWKPGDPWSLWKDIIYILFKAKSSL